jgi:hypothetical protein
LVASDYLGRSQGGKQLVSEISGWQATCQKDLREANNLSERSHGGKQLFREISGKQATCLFLMKNVGFHGRRYKKWTSSSQISVRSGV